MGNPFPYHFFKAMDAKSVPEAVEMRSAALKSMCGNTGSCNHPAKENLYVVPMITSCSAVALKEQIFFTIDRMDLRLIPSTVFHNGIADRKNPVLVIFRICNTEGLFF